MKRTTGMGRWLLAVGLGAAACGSPTESTLTIDFHLVGEVRWADAELVVDYRVVNTSSQSAEVYPGCAGVLFAIIERLIDGTWRVHAHGQCPGGSPATGPVPVGSGAESGGGRTVWPTPAGRYRLRLDYTFPGHQEARTAYSESFELR